MMKKSKLGVLLIPAFILLTSFIHGSNGQSVDNANLVNCYPVNTAGLEFTAFASHLTASTLTTKTCAQACYAVNYALAGIRDGTRCFCKKTNAISASPASLTTLCSPASGYNVCPGDATIICGATGYMFVYTASPSSSSANLNLTSLSMTDLNSGLITSSNGMTLFSRFNIKTSFALSASKSYFRENLESVRSDNVLSLTSLNFQHPLENTGYEAYEFIISTGADNALSSSRKAIRSPLAVDQIGGLSISCPTPISISEYLRCDVSFVNGTKLSVSINYDDGNTEIFSLADFDTIPYGFPVPKQISTLASQNLNTGTPPYYFAMNAEILTSGYLRALEIYAETPGVVNFYLSGKPSITGNAYRNQDYSETTIKLSSTYSCSVFTRSNQNCQSMSKSSRFVSFTLNDVGVLIPITLQAGYNLITSSVLGQISVLPGYIPYFAFQTGRIAVDSSGTAPLSDWFYDTLIGYNKLSASQNWRLYVRAIVTPSMKGLGLFHAYTTAGTYTVTATVSNPYLTTPSLTVSQLVTLTPLPVSIANLTLVTTSGTPNVCFLNVACGFQANVLVGNPTLYDFTLGSTTNTTNQSLFYYTFTSTGAYSVSVTARNSISFATYTLSITISSGIGGLSFKAGNMPNSSSIVGQPANFLFIIKVGSNYQCTINYGDGSPIATISDASAYINNTYVSHTYTSENVYSVNITCASPTNVLNQTFSHYAQYPLLGLALTSTGTLVNTAYSIAFTLTSGSFPNQFLFYIDGVLDTGAMYSNLAGQSSNRAAETTPAVHTVFINMTNEVSTIQLNGTFQVSSPLQNVKFAVLPASGISAYTYLYPAYLNLTTSMTSGANVLISISADSGNPTGSTLPNNTVSVQTTGTWVDPNVITYFYVNPGAYTLRANISNSLVSYGFTQAVKIMSTVNDLIPNLVTNSNKVVFQSFDGGVTGTALAQFVFNYVGNTKSGSDAFVTFWPGDTANSTYGPFALNMDFNANVSRSPLQYTYTALGTYTATFFVTNPLGSKYYTFPITVVFSLMGFYVDVSPSFTTVGTAVNVNAYLIQGNNVQYQWLVDSSEIASGTRASTSYSTPDTRVFTPTSAVNYTLSVTATDVVNSVTITKSIVLQVQAPITTMSVSVNPSTPQINIDNSPSSRTFTFTINVGAAPTNTFYLIDFNDGSPVSLPTYMPTTSSQVSYTYASSGIYNVNVTAINKISTMSRIVTVQIFSDFIGFNCTPYWRMFPSDTCADYPYNLTGGAYSVRAEYDVRFFCTWTRLDALPTQFTVTVNSVLKQSFTNTSLLTKLSSSGSIGYVIPLYTTNIAAGSVSIAAINPSYTRTYSATLAPYSALSQVQWVPLSSSFQAGTNQTFQIEYQSLGEPSCVLISFTTSSNVTTTIGLMGTSSATCTSFYPTISTSLYMGDYLNMKTPNTSNSLSFITSKVSQIGNILMTARIVNSQSFISTKTNVTAVLQLGLCEIPTLDISNRSEYFYQPKKYSRSDTIVFSAVTVLNCSSGLSNTKQWSLYRIDPSTGSQLGQVSLASNPSASYAELVISPNTLGYNLYKAVYQVSMSFNSIYTNQIETYFQIAPAGLVISTLYGAPGGGTFETSRGIGQSIQLDPVSYSYDIDAVVQMKSLRFLYYCQVIDNGVAAGYPQLFYNQNLDLLTTKTNYSTNPAIQQLMLSTTTPSCFTSTSGYSFDTTNNSLIIQAGALPYLANRKYQILAQTTYLGTNYFQNVVFEIQNVNYVPLLTLNCKFADSCVPYGGYVKINPNTQLILLGSCYSGCTNLLNIQYKYNAYQSWSLSPTSPQTVWFPYQNATQLLGQTTTELNIQSSLFTSNPSILLWKFEFTLTSTTPANGIATGQSSMIVLVNKLPYGGTCTVSPLTGVALNTSFTITCSNWVDDDGNIAKYGYFATMVGQQAEVGLGSSLTGITTTQLPTGSPTDSNRLSIYVNIMDNDNGITTFVINTPVQVNTDAAVLNSIIEQLSNPASTGAINNVLASGNSQAATSVLLTVSSLLNSVSVSSNLTANESAALSNQQAVMRDYLSTFVNTLSITDVNSISNQAAMLTSLTSSTGEITRNLADAVTNQCIRLIESLSSSNGKVSTAQLQSAAISITNTLANVIGGLSTYLNGQQSNLDLDYERAIALPEYYDSNLENYDTNPNNFFGNYGPDATQEQQNTLKNVAKQQFLNVDIAQKVDTITDLISNLVAQRFAVGQSFSVSSPSITMQLQKLIASNLSSLINLDYAKVALPSFCDLMVNTLATTTTTTKSPFINLNDADNCTNKIITLKSVLLSSSISGFNSRNETHTGTSKGLELSFLDQYGNVIQVENLLTSIELWIPRTPTDDEDRYQTVNTTNITVSADLQIFPNSMNISSTNASLHMQIVPEVFDVAYLVLLKRGSTPFISRNKSSYDYWKVLCPGSSDIYWVNDNITGTNDTFYLIFRNMSWVNGYKGMIGYGIRELTASEQPIYCSNASLIPDTPPVYPNSLNFTRFTRSFRIKTYTSGCYYYNTNTGKWSNMGMEIFADTNLFMTHCLTNHLTQFAGGLVVVPSKIDFTYFVENASPAKNPTIYSVVLVAICVYLICLAWAYRADVLDERRLGVNVLPDNMFGDIYSYEVVVFTGNRHEAATDSKVKMILNGDLDETSERTLESKSTKTKVFRHGGVDSFLMTVSRPLGKLNYMRIWHDNSGLDGNASWYLKFIMIHDLQTREKFYFPCFNWLAVERADGKINRTLGVAGRKQIRDLALYAEKNMNDGHLWLSIFSKPLYSTLTRVDRTACCFLIFYVFMLASIMYYSVDSAPDVGTFRFGPFLFTTTQIGIALAVNLMVMIPAGIIIFLLKRCKVRLTKSRKLKNAIEVNMETINYSEFSSIDGPGSETSDYSAQNEQNKNSNKYMSRPSNVSDSAAAVGAAPVELKPKRSKFLLPWWMRIAIHIVINIMIITAAFFIIVKGVDFGDERVQRWLASLLVTVVTSIVFIQPLQVMAVACFISKMFRKRINSTDLEYENDHEDTGKNLNKYWHFKEVDYKTNPFKSFYTDSIQVNEHQLEYARETRLRQIRIRQAIREIAIYLVLIFILFYINYTNTGQSAYDYANALKKQFDIDEFRTVDEFWDWTINTLAVGLRANTWYNGRQPYGLAGYTNDFVSRMIGYGLMRQIRVGNNSCSLPGQMQSQVSFCEADYNLFVEEKNNFGFGWSTYNSSYTPPHGTQQMYNAFQYQDASRLSGYPYTGVYTTYAGDGYVYELRGSLRFVKGNLSMLQQMGWVDRQTRAVFFQFALYNPNINMLSVATILVEFLPTGKIITFPRFDPLNLFNEVNSAEGTTLKIAIYIGYLILVFYFMVRELIELYKVGFRSYFQRFWNYIEWLLILLSMLAFGLFFYRLSVAYEVMDFFKRTSGYGYINLQGINNWNQILTIALALCCALGTIRLLKLFRFYKKIYALALTLKHCLKELMGFGLMFLFVWVAFVQMLYLYFYDKLESYWNPMKAFTTSFECLVGKFDRNLNQSLDYAIGPYIFTLYPIVMAFMMINIFVTIVCEAFKDVRFEINKHSDDLRVIDYFNDKLKERFSDKSARSRVHNEKYLDPAKKLPNNINRLIDNLSKAYQENICVDRMLSHTKNISRK